MPDSTELIPGSKKAPPPRILTVEEAVAESVFDKEFAGLKKELEDQRSVMWQVVIGVAVAFVLAVGVIVVDAILARETSVKQFNAIQENLTNQAIRTGYLSNELENLRIRNFLR